MRRISFALTRDSFLDGSKTVTRRKGWKNLKPGTRLLAVSKCMGLKPGESAEVYGPIEVVSVRRECLNVIVLGDWDGPPNPECVAEGLPKWNGVRFITMFCADLGGAREQIVTRIEFRRVEPRALDGVKLSAAMARTVVMASEGRTGAPVRRRGRERRGATSTTMEALHRRGLVEWLGNDFWGRCYGLTDLGRQVAAELREGGQ